MEQEFYNEALYKLNKNTRTVLKFLLSGKGYILKDLEIYREDGELMNQRAINACVGSIRRWERKTMGKTIINYEKIIDSNISFVQIEKNEIKPLKIAFENIENKIKSQLKKLEELYSEQKKILEGQAKKLDEQILKIKLSLN